MNSKEELVKAITRVILNTYKEPKTDWSEVNGIQALSMLRHELLEEKKK